jgi:hypothetical protein
MKKEFVPYDLALRMKALGFDEPCMAYYNKSKKLHFDKYTTSHWSSTCLAPLYQQAFRWFRDEHGMSGSIQIEHDAYQWGIFEEGETSGLASDNWDGTDYEEAELACLTKLIELVESQTK